MDLLITDVFWFEHLRKWDPRRYTNLMKLKDLGQSFLLVPGIGEMFRAESESRKPASEVLEFRVGTLTDQIRMKDKFFELDEETKRISAERAAEWNERLDTMVEVWLDFKQFPEFQDVRSEDLPPIVRDKKLQIRDDRNDMRGFYERHRHQDNPPCELLDEKWAFFRWIQVQLLAGLDFFASYGLGAAFNRENLFHELLDLEYLISALAVGGLASREIRMIERFRFLCPEGSVLE